MNELKKEPITKYEQSYRNYAEYLSKMADIAFRCDTKANMLVDGDITREMRLYATNNQISDLKNIRLAFGQVKKYSIEQLVNKLAYFNNQLNDSMISVEEQITNLNVIELLNACINLYPKLRLN